MQLSLAVDGPSDSSVLAISHGSTRAIQALFAAFPPKNSLLPISCYPLRRHHGRIRANEGPAIQRVLTGSQIRKLLVLQQGHTQGREQRFKPRVRLPPAAFQFFFIIFFFWQGSGTLSIGFYRPLLDGRYELVGITGSASPFGSISAHGFYFPPILLTYVRPNRSLAVGLIWARYFLFLIQTTHSFAIYDWFRLSYTLNISNHKKNNPIFLTIEIITVIDPYSTSHLFTINDLSRNCF